MPNRPDVFSASNLTKPRAVRPKTASRGYGSKWQRESKQWLRVPGNSMCAEHLRRGEHVAAKVVDHIKPHKQNPRLFWDRKNWQGLCISCHNRKSQTE
jgi:5-methylcytosine-specific restriction protein A